MPDDRHLARSHSANLLRHLRHAALLAAFLPMEFAPSARCRWLDHSLSARSRRHRSRDGPGPRADRGHLQCRKFRTELRSGPVAPSWDRGSLYPVRRLVRATQEPCPRARHVRTTLTNRDRAPARGYCRGQLRSQSRDRRDARRFSSRQSGASASQHSRGGPARHLHPRRCPLLSLAG